jgi:hypothetical protein
MLGFLVGVVEADAIVLADALQHVPQQQRDFRRMRGPGSRSNTSVVGVS